MCARVSEPCKISLNVSGDNSLMVTLSGIWQIGINLPEAADIFNQIESNRSIERICFNTGNLNSWDSSLLIFLDKIIKESLRRKIRINQDGLPDGVRRLLKLASAVPPKKETNRESKRLPIVARVGEGAISFISSSLEMFTFTGEAFLAFSHFLVGRAHFRRSDLILYIQECGARALPIVTLISLLVGLILAFVGAVQLKMFGAQIYVANLVGLGMAREMGAMMSGIIMAGRTGAAFAAQLGTMQVNEEIDALKTLGITPMEFLVVPRMIALVMMMPLLCLYADFMGILGGTVVGVGMLDLSFMQYYQQTRTSIHLIDFSLGLIKSVVFGVIVAMSGCLRGIQCGRSASAVGDATTSAVVTGIVWIIISDAVLTVIYSVLGI